MNLSRPENADDSVSYCFRGKEISSEDIAGILRRAGRFHLWEGHFIGEATVVP
jgi:selenocysteine lyase/cysteine desulfurase